MTTVQAVNLPTYEADELKQPLFAHQLLMLRAWSSLETALLSAPTGGGKTAAAFLPALLRGESVIAAYPTNTLLRDQAEALITLCQLAGNRARILWPEELAPTIQGEQVQIVPIDGPALERGRLALGKKYKGQVLDELLTVSALPRIILTNPDVLYLLTAMRYRESQSGVSRLAQYSTLVIDEFHLYSGVELARLLYLAFLLRTFGGQVANGLRRCLLLSATPPQEVVALLTEVFPGLQQITPASRPSGHPVQAGQRTIMYPVRFQIGLPLAGEPKADRLEQVAEFVHTHGTRLREGRARLGARTVPLLVFLNSVVDARRLEQMLFGHGWDAQDIGAVRGLMDTAEREWQGKTIVIGTAAAEVGIDFDCRELIFEAEEEAAFIQRLSRAGRHAPADAFLLDPPGSPAAAHLRSELSSRQEIIARAEFLRLAGAVLPSMSSQTDFCASEYGVFAAASLTQHVLDRVVSDWGAGEAARQRVESTLLQAETEYFVQWQKQRASSPRDVHQVHSQVRRYMRLAQQGKTAAYGWMKEYAGHFPSFRPQVPQVEVFDEQEQTAGRSPRYLADLRTLARWATIGSDHQTEDHHLVMDVTGFAATPRRYCVILRRPLSWPAAAAWPPEGLFWLGPYAYGQGEYVAATLVADSTGGVFPGPFPSGDGPMLGLIVTRRQLQAGSFDWRLQSWPLRGQAGTADTAVSKILLLGDACLLVRAQVKAAESG